MLGKVLFNSQNNHEVIDFDFAFYPLGLRGVLFQRACLTSLRRVNE